MSSIANISIDADLALWRDRLMPLLELPVAERARELSLALAQLRDQSAHAQPVCDKAQLGTAHDIHNELGSLLVALKQDLDWMEKRVAERGPLAGKCRSMNRLIEQAFVNLGCLITDQGDGMENREGLIAALEWQIREFSLATEMQCNSTIELEPDSVAPEGVLATMALRIFQEMLNNVVRHARATSVRIRIKLARALLQMDVTDDGVGALPESFERSRSYGIVGMRKQAVNCGGTLHIFSVQGGGTHVCLRLPLTSPGAAA